MGSEEGMIIDIINTIKGTRPSAELNFEDLKISIPGINIGVVISGKLTFQVRVITDDSE